MNYGDQLRNIIAEALPQLRAIRSEEFGRKPSPDKWSKKELLGHLIDSAYNNHQRFLGAESQSDLVFNGYDQEGWVRKNNYQQRDPEEVIATWEVVNQHLAYLIEGLSGDLLNRQTTDHNFHLIGMNRPLPGVPSSLGYLVWDYIFHIEHHLTQILPAYTRVLGPFQ